MNATTMIYYCEMLFKSKRRAEPKEKKDKESSKFASHFPTAFLLTLPFFHFVTCHESAVLSIRIGLTLHNK